MQTPKGKTAAADAQVGLWAVALTSFVIATLFFARDFLIPRACRIAHLSPVAIGRENRALAGADRGGVLTRQLVDLASKLPDYKENIQTKLRSIKVPIGGAFRKFSQTLEELKKDLPGAETPTQAMMFAAGTLNTSEALPPNPAPAAASVQLETSKVNPVELVQHLIAPLLGPLGTAALVVLLVIFMLLRREDLRRRLIRLIGKGALAPPRTRWTRPALASFAISLCNLWSM